MKTHCHLLILAGCLLAGCAQAAPHSRPAALDPLAAQFKAIANTNRVAVGKKIAALMPDCRQIHGHKWHWLFLGLDEEVSTDWNHPSYRLPKDDLFQALGQPDHMLSFNSGGDWIYAWYQLGRDKKNQELGLYIRCYSNSVVSGFVTKTNTVESISTRINPGGSVTVKTNYIQ